MNLSNLITRTIAGIAYIGLIVGGLFLGNISFGLLCAIILIFSLDEYFRLLKKMKMKTPSILAIISGAILFLMVMLFKNEIIGVEWLAIFPLFFLAFMVEEMLSKHRNTFNNVAVTSFGLIYLVIPMVSLYLIGFYNKYSWSNDFSHEILLGFFILTWGSDTGAYLVGSFFGRNKLFERISPKKTIEGSVGGLLLTGVLAYVVSIYYTQISSLDWIIIAILITIFGTLGDLFESVLKRKAEVKDSGKILPGHGGMLDRFDSIFFSAPVVFIYLNLIGH